MEDQLETKNKEIVRRFNAACIAGGDRDAFGELVAPDFVDHTAPPENASADAMAFFIFDLLRVAIPDLAIDIHDLIAEGDRVTTRKTFHGTFSQDLLGVPATKQRIAIDVIDILVMRDGRIVEHWGMNNFGRP